MLNLNLWEYLYLAALVLFWESHGLILGNCQLFLSNFMAIVLSLQIFFWMHRLHQQLLCSELLFFFFNKSDRDAKLARNSRQCLSFCTAVVERQQQLTGMSELSVLALCIYLKTVAVQAQAAFILQSHEARAHQRGQAI